MSDSQNALTKCNFHSPRKWITPIPPNFCNKARHAGIVSLEIIYLIIMMIMIIITITIKMKFLVYFNIFIRIVIVNIFTS